MSLIRGPGTHAHARKEESGALRLPCCIIAAVRQECNLTSHSYSPPQSWALHITLAFFLVLLYSTLHLMVLSLIGRE